MRAHPRAHAPRAGAGAAGARAPAAGAGAALARPALRVAAATAAPAPAAPARARVYLVRVPLEGLGALAAALPAPLAARLALHEVVVVAAPGGGGGRIAAYDFLPADPLAPATATRLAAGLAVRAVARCRPLRAVPRRRCRAAGESVLADPHAVAEAFQAEWAALELALGRRDCRDHARALVAALTGGVSA
jgi:hypothetical protein